MSQQPAPADPLLPAPAPPAAARARQWSRTPWGHLQRNLTGRLILGPGEQTLGDPMQLSRVATNVALVGPESA